MALTTVNDLIKGIDFTVLNQVSAASLNQVVELAIPTVGTNGDGVGLALSTHDTALNTPVVPDAATNTKWKTYLWIRFPYANGVPSVYGWVDGAVSGALLKWTLISDTATIQTNINTLTATVAGYTAAIATANANANAAGNLASQAIAEADLAGSLVNGVAGQRNPSDLLIVGTSLQQIRTNLAGTLAEWFTPTAFDILIVDERKNAGTNAGGDAGANSNDARIFNTTVANTNTWGALDTSVPTNPGIKITLNGIYYVEGWATGYNTRHRTSLRISTNGVNDGGALATSYTLAIPILGSPITAAAAITQNTVSRIEGIIQVACNPANAAWIYLYHFMKDGDANNHGLALNDGANKEVYAGIKIIKLS